MAWVGWVKCTADLTARSSSVFRSVRFIPNSLFVPMTSKPDPALLGADLVLRSRRQIGEESLKIPAVEVVNVAAPNNLHLEIVRHAASQRQAYLLREAGWPESPGNCGNRAPCPPGRRHDFRWLQLSVGAVGAVWTEADPGRCAGQSHSLSRPFLCRIRQRSQRSSVMAISARPCRIGSLG